MNNMYIESLKKFESQHGNLEFLGQYILNDFEVLSAEVYKVCEAIERTQRSMKILSEDKEKRQLQTLIEEHEFQKLAEEVVGFLENIEQEDKLSVYNELLMLLKVVYKKAKSPNSHSIRTTDDSNSIIKTDRVYFLSEIEWEAYEKHLKPYIEEYIKDFEAKINNFSGEFK